MLDPLLYNLGLIAGGACTFLGIKIVADMRERNKALFIWQSYGMSRKKANRLDIVALVNAITKRELKNRTAFITKDLPVSVGELKEEFCGDDAVGVEDEIYYLIEKSNPEYGIYKNTIYSGDAYDATCSRMLYERGLYNDGYNIGKRASDLMSKNNFVKPSRMSLNQLEKGKKVNLMLISETQKMEFYRRLFSPLPGNGMALVFACDGVLSPVFPD